MSIKRLIEVLGYSESSSLYYDYYQFESKVDPHHSLSKTIKELNPKAFYCIDNKPFILFFESSYKNKSLIKKIWNAQIPLVIFSYNNRIEIYNGCSINLNKDLILIDKFDNSSLDNTTPFSYWNISNASFWKKYEKKLMTPKLDDKLLENIMEATNILKKTNCAPFAVRLILRLIFIRYLIDRGVDLNYVGLNGNMDKTKNNFLNIIKNKDQLYDLFTYLKNQFNGNLFELYENNTHAEIELVDDKALKILHDLMSGELILSSGQYSLFPLYDFNIIPVELISSIYERFLGYERQQIDKAFYTPPYLVEYLISQTIEPFLEYNDECKILDPACGSGIFLVQSVRKLIENTIARQNESYDDEILIKAVVNNIWGVDKNPEAIDVAVFSIYLTILDYKDPKTLKNFRLPMLKNKNLFACDFFLEEIDKHLCDKHFDFIIGNPPWGSIKGEHVNYCEKRNLPLQNNEISRSFILRSKDFADNSTCCCLIVTSKLFYNIKSPAVDFRKWLLSNTHIIKYIELAAVRELIFSKVRGPAGIVIYKFNENKEANLSNILCHLTLKPNIFFKLFKIIVIEKNDYKYIQQKLLYEDDWAWKTLVFGYTHDFYLIKRLKNNYKSVKQIIENNQLSYGVGLQVHDGGHDASHLKGRWLIDARKGVGAFYVNLQNGCFFTKDKIHRSKANKKELFSPPYTLIKKGFNIQSYKYRAVYSEESFIYSDAITGICGTDKNKQTLLSLAGLINSSLYAYFNLMLGSSSGIEREQGFPTEIFMYPAIDDKEISELVKIIQDKVKSNNENLKFSLDNEIEDLITKLDEMILHKFELSNDEFVDYALKVQIPLLSNTKYVWEEATNEQLYEYAHVFIGFFNEILSNSDKFLLTKIYKGVGTHFNAIEFLLQDNEPEEPIIFYEEIHNSNMEFNSRFMLTRYNDKFYKVKDVFNFGESSFSILKTNEYKNWHPAMAKLDLSDVIDSILAGSEVF